MPSLNPIRLRGVPSSAVPAQKPLCTQRICGGAIGQRGELAHRVERHLRIVGAGLDRKVAAAMRLDQLVAVEAGQIDQRRGALRRQAVAVLAVLDEQAGAEAEGEGQPRRRQPDHIAAVAGRLHRILGQRHRGLAGRHARRRRGPVAQQPRDIGALLGLRSKAAK